MLFQSKEEKRLLAECEQLKEQLENEKENARKLTLQLNDAQSGEEKALEDQKKKDEEIALLRKQVEELQNQAAKQDDLYAKSINTLKEHEILFESVQKKYDDLYAVNQMLEEEANRLTALNSVFSCSENSSLSDRAEKVKQSITLLTDNLISIRKSIKEIDPVFISAFLKAFELSEIQEVLKYLNEEKEKIEKLKENIKSLEKYEALKSQRKLLCTSESKVLYLMECIGVKNIESLDKKLGFKGKISEQYEAYKTMLEGFLNDTQYRDILQEKFELIKDNGKTPKEVVQLQILSIMRYLSKEIPTELASTIKTVAEKKREENGDQQ